VHTRKLLIEGKPLDLAKRGWKWLLARREARRAAAGHIHP